MRANGSFMKRPTKGELERALLAACVMAYGRACHRTSNGVPMGMPKRAERIVRPVLAALGKGEAK
jgi:hypothetical protein